MHNSDRRHFIRTGIAAAAGAAVTGIAPRRIFAESSKFTRIAYRELGSTGCLVSEIGFGAMNMRDPELLGAALDYGINYIDTAWAYMNGVNEQVVGQVTKPVRDRVFITTKVIPTGEGKKILDETLSKMEMSLKRLQTDHVDLMLCHALNSRRHVLHEGLMKIFDRAREMGICRFVGFSTHENNAEVVNAAVDSGFWQAVLVGYNYMSPPEVAAAIERARKAGIGIIGMKNLLNPIDLATWNWETIRDIRKNENSPLSPTQALIKYVLDDSNVDTTVPGITSFEQLAEDVAIMGMRMGFDDRDSLMRYGETIRGRYCRGVAGCTDCEGQCPKGVGVHDLNRCLAYANGYRDIRLAYEQYELLSGSSRVSQCADCSECVVRCPHGIDLTDSVRRAQAIFERTPV